MKTASGDPCVLLLPGRSTITVGEMRRGLTQILHPRELRFVGSRALVVIGLGILGGAFWFSPWSPAALDNAASLAARGDSDGAIAAYLDVADGPAFRGVREEALWQAAWLASVDGDHPQQAVELLRAYVQQAPGSARAAQAQERLATLYRLYLGDPIRAAEAWEHAADLSPAHAAAGRWQLDAGLAYMEAGLNDRARDAFDRAVAHPDVRVAAHLALGRVYLLDDPAAAYDHYSQALVSAQDPGDASLARLGAATALEALDEVGQALAELEGGDENDPALQRRRARLSARDRR